MDLSAESHVVVCGLQHLILLHRNHAVEETTAVVSVGYVSPVGHPWPPPPFLLVSHRIMLGFLFSFISATQQAPSPVVGGLVPLGVHGVHLCPPCPFWHSTEDVLTTQAKSTPHGVAMHLMAF